MKNIIKIHILKPKLHDEMLQQATHRNIGNPNLNPDSTYRVPSRVYMHILIKSIIKKFSANPIEISNTKSTIFTSNPKYMNNINEQYPIGYNKQKYTGKSLAICKLGL